MTEAMLRIAPMDDLDTLVWRVATLREQFLSGHEVDLSPIRTVIRDSWQRCRALAVRADLSLAHVAIPNDHQLHDLRERHTVFLRAASPVLLRLRATLGDVGYVVAVSDADGTLLEVDGDPDCRRRLGRKGLLPGSNWSEAVAGTNAIGVALATRRVVQLVGSEHYCAGWQDVTCTAAPVVHPDDGRMIGVLDITGDYRLAHPFLTGLLAAAVAEVQRRYRLERVIRSVRPHTFKGWTPPSQVETSAPVVHYQPDHLERLAAAVRIVSGIFDPGNGPSVIAEQMGQLLDAAGVALVEGTSVDALNAHFWTTPDSKGEEALAILQAAVCDPVTLAWRTYLAPFVTASGDAPTLAGFPLPDISGVILVVRIPARPWSPADQQSGATLAAHGTAMLRHTRLYTDLQAYAAQTEVLNTLALFLNTLLDPMQQIDVVLQRLLALTRLDVGLIVLNEEKHLAVAGIPKTVIERAQIEALIQTVISTGQPVWLCRQHAALEPALLLLTDLCDLVALPLAPGTTAAGILLVGSRAHRHISGEDLTFLLTIAHQLGLTLSNARLRRVAGENEALRQANHLKSVFLASVSHDLRSPLTAIRASVEDLLERQYEAPASEHRALLCNIARETSRLSQFVDQLLDLSRIEAGTLPIDREWVELGALVSDVVASFHQHFPDCVIETSISPALPLLYIDPVLISQVLCNLIENAQKYGPAAGPITIEASCTSTHLVMSVGDRGPGIPKTDRHRIFDRFYRLERDRRSHRSGSGLGLAICHGIITAHQGSIWVDDRPGGGSIFHLELPLSDEQPVPWFHEEETV
ncbi:ATP-binding protein [Roseiflexus sp.]|uniref:ATP-binding protein n=1 Tax=Roseiflexus sp. TaxID=2562120 RepID=UPI00398AF3D0